MMFEGGKLQRLSSFGLVAVDREIDALAIKALDLHLNCFRHQPRITLGQMVALHSCTTLKAMFEFQYQIKLLLGAK